MKLPEQILVTITNTNLLFNTRDRLKMINITFNSLTSDRAFSSKSISHSLKNQLSTKTVWTFDNNSSCLWSLFVLLKQALRSVLTQMSFQVQIFSLELARLLGTSFSYSYKLCFALFKPWQFGSVTPSLHIRSVNFVDSKASLTGEGRFLVIIQSLLCSIAVMIAHKRTLKVLSDVQPSSDLVFWINKAMISPIILKKRRFSTS